MRKVAIEGLDGSGKTTVSHALAEHFTAQGLHTRVVSLYREANAEFGSNLYDLWVDPTHAPDAIRHLKDTLERIETEAVASEVDVLIFDRHWMTIFTDIVDDPELVRLWGDAFVPTAYLRVQPEIARQRAVNDQHEPWMTPEAYSQYQQKYEGLCRQFGHAVLGVYRNDNDVSLDMMVRSIEWDMNIRR